MPSSFASILTILIGMYGLRLAYAGQLIYYIHPRYVGLTVAACLLVVTAGIVAFVLSPVPKHTRRRRANGILGALPIVLFVSIGNLVPAKALSSAAAQQRSTSVAIQQPAPEEDVTSGVTDVSTLDTSEWAFDDFWYSLMMQDRALEHYEGKSVNILGFVSHPRSSPAGTFYLTRFLLMCCAIDAQPVGFWVREDPSTVRGNDTWVRVKGSFHAIDWDGKKTLIIEPQAIDAAEEPPDPYVY